jgi:hypothetical protein
LRGESILIEYGNSSHDKMVIKLNSTLADLLTRNVSMAGQVLTLNFERRHVFSIAQTNTRLAITIVTVPLFIRTLYLKKGSKKASERSAHMAVHRGGHRGIVSARNLFAEHLSHGR